MKAFRGMVATLLPLVLVLLVGCGTKVTRIDPSSETDLSGRWNDTDSRLVSEEMILSCLGSPWKSKHVRDTSKDPIVIVGIVQNKTSEHIAIDTFINDMERAMINSGEVTVVASAEERESLRGEREDQQAYSSEETVKEWGRELGADYMLGGMISSIIDQIQGQKIVYYQVDLTLINLETNAKVWLGQKKIKKNIDRPSASL